MPKPGQPITAAETLVCQAPSYDTPLGAGIRSNWPNARILIHSHLLQPAGHRLVPRQLYRIHPRPGLTTTLRKDVADLEPRTMGRFEASVKGESEGQIR